MSKWIYQTKHTTESDANIREDLDKVGQDGWELVSVIQDREDGGSTYYFKKLVEEDVSPKEVPFVWV